MRKRKTVAAFDMNELMNDSDKRTQLQGFVEEMALALDQVNNKKIDIKNMRTEAKESLGIPPRLLMKLVREHNEKGYIASEIKGLEDVQALSEAVLP